MAIINIQDIYSSVYEEIVTEITREETELVDRAITRATDEAKMYLSRWDLMALFGDDDTAPTVNDTFLKDICVDIAVYRLVLLGAPNIKLETAKEGYKDAVRSLEKLQAGRMQPDGWPYKDTTGETAPNGNSIEWSSNARRRNHFD